MGPHAGGRIGGERRWRARAALPRRRGAGPCMGRAARALRQRQGCRHTRRKGERTDAEREMRDDDGPGTRVSPIGEAATMMVAPPVGGADRGGESAARWAREDGC